MRNKIKRNLNFKKILGLISLFILFFSMQTSFVSSLLSSSKIITNFGEISYIQPSFLFYENFESEYSSSWSYLKNAVIESDTVFSGKNSIMFYHDSYGYINISESSAYIETVFFVNTLPQSELRLELLRVFDDNNNVIGVVHLTNDELYFYRLQPNINGISSLYNLQEKTWYKIGFQYDANGYNILINDILFISDQIATSNPIGAVLFGQYSSTDYSEIYFDNLVISKDLPILTEPMSDPVSSSSSESSTTTNTTLSWSIIGEDYLLYTNGDPDSIWTPARLSKLAQWESKTMRISFSFADSTPNSGGILSMSVYDVQKMDRTLDLLGSVGVKGILNLHNVNGDMYGDVGSWNWINNWKTLAQIYLNDPRIVAFQIFNEPIPETWASDGPLGVIDTPRKLVEAFGYCIDEIRAIDPSRTIIYPVWYGCGITYASMNEWYDDLQYTGILNKGNIVYDVIHPYYFENSWDMNLDPIGKVAHYRDNYLVPAINLFGAENVWVGETFAWPEYDGGTHDLQVEFLTEMINACLDLGVGVQVFSYYGKSAWQDESLAASNYLD